MPNFHGKSGAVPVLPASALLPPPAYDTFQSSTSSRDTYSLRNPSASAANAQIREHSFSIAPVPDDLNGPPQFSPVPAQRPSSGPSLQCQCQRQLAMSTPAPGTQAAPPLPVYGAQFTVAHGATSCHGPQCKQSISK